MASPVNIRNTVLVPFPSLVRGSAPLIVTKANGIWVIALDVAGLTAHVPSVADLAQEYWIVYDAAQDTFFKVLLSTLGLGGARLQRSAVASPIVVAPNDQIINFNINAAAVCTLPSSATRSGVPLTFQDVGGHATAHPLVFSLTGGELADGVANPAITVNYGKMTFTPLTDGVNTGYSIS
jgi:hypothetical protein